MPERLLKKTHRFLNANEVRRLVAACTEPTRTIVLLAIMTGLRIGEILALRWKRIDFIRETLVGAETCYLRRFGTPKTRASKREVPLSSDVVEALKTHFSISANRNPEALVFELSWHSLRHTHGTVQGTPLKLAQAQLDLAFRLGNNS